LDFGQESLITFGRIGRKPFGAMSRVPEETEYTVNQLLGFGRIKEAMGRIEAGSDPNEVDDRGFTPILHAAARGSWIAFEALVKRGADLEWKGQEGETLFDFAFAGMVRGNWKYWSQRQIRDCKKMVECLDETGLLEPEQQALHAIAKNRWKRVAELIAGGLPVDATSPDWNCEIALQPLAEKIGVLYEQIRPRRKSLTYTKRPTLLMWAAAMGRFGICEALIAAGANENHRDAFGSTAKDYVTFYRKKYAGHVV
jgi:hypothetical protein